MSRPRCIVVGGNGGLVSQYRRAVDAAGYDLDYHEKTTPRAAHSTTSRIGAQKVDRIGAVVVFVTNCGHAQRDAAVAIARDVGLTPHYLRTASPSALRRALEPTEARADATR